MASSSIGAPDDPIGIMLPVPTGGNGAEFLGRAYMEGSDEIKDLMKYEIDVIYECRFCRNLYRSIANVIAHKRQYCRSSCRTNIHNVLSKHAEELCPDKDKEKRKLPGKSKVNVVSAVQKKIQTTTIEDDLNRIELYTLPTVSRYLPTTTFEDGYQAVTRMNELMAIKERVPDDGALLIMPQDDSRHCQADMTLRRKTKMEKEEKTMSWRELIVLDFIYKDVLDSVNPAACQCLFSTCKDVKPFGDVLALAYHLTVKHNRPMTAQDYAKVGRGKEGWYACFLCKTVHRSSDKLNAHLLKDHAEVKQKHIEKRKKDAETQSAKSKKKESPNRPGSLSPIDSDVDEDTRASNSEPKKGSSVATPKTAKPGNRRGRRKPGKKKTVKVLNEVKEKLKNLESSQKDEELEEEQEIEPETEQTELNEQNDEKELDDNCETRSESSPDTQSRTPEPESSLAERRARRTLRRPRNITNFDFATTEEEFKASGKAPPKKKHKFSLTSASATESPYQVEMVTVKSEVTEDEPVQSAAFSENTSTSGEVGVSPVKAMSREALMQSIKKAKTASPVKPQNIKKGKNKDSYSQLDFPDMTNWVLPPSSSQNGSELSSPSKGSGRRKQLLNVSDDNSNNDILKIAEEQISPESSASNIGRSRTAMLDSMTFEFVNNDKTKFLRALKYLPAMGSYTCLECMATIATEELGIRHVLSHVRVVRFRCALCDVGAFYLEDMRNHLMKKFCPKLEYAPESYLISGDGPIVMNQEHADQLIQIVHGQMPGQYQYTTGKIVCENNYVPHIPQPEYERNIIGPDADILTVATPKKAEILRKSIPNILNKPRSPMKTPTSGNAKEVPPKEVTPTRPLSFTPSMEKPETPVNESTKRSMTVPSSFPRAMTPKQAQPQRPLSSQYLSTHMGSEISKSRSEERSVTDSQGSTVTDAVLSEMSQETLVDFQSSSVETGENLPTVISQESKNTPVQVSIPDDAMETDVAQ